MAVVHRMKRNVVSVPNYRRDLFVCLPDFYATCLLVIQTDGSNAAPPSGYADLSVHVSNCHLLSPRTTFLIQRTYAFLLPWCTRRQPNRVMERRCGREQRGRADHEPQARACQSRWIRHHRWLSLSQGARENLLSKGSFFEMPFDLVFL